MESKVFIVAILLVLSNKPTVDSEGTVSLFDVSLKQHLTSSLEMSPTIETTSSIASSTSSISPMASFKYKIVSSSTSANKVGFNSVFRIIYLKLNGYLKIN
eukprot:m.117334 g.117334  ORF g.117334 m.117334 type:complete len:101 (+) comp12873_c0_seq4:2493-2795(+)